jgi:uncharacterized protein (TIGR02271 family)
MTDAMSPTPSAATRTLSAMFDTREDAERAVQTLIDEGIPQERVRLTPGAERDSTGSPGTASRDRDEGGFWHSLEEFFFPDEDRAEYAEGLRRGGYLVTVQATQAEHDLALDILDDEGTIDIDDRADSWRREGWSGTGALSGGAGAGRSSSTSGAAAGGNAGSFGDAVRGMSGATAQGRGTDAVIPVAEEELQVGKREVEGGRVRVRSYVVETPVQEQVMLRREHVDVERRQVDRPLDSAEDAFRERTVELDERSEQPVVNKQARVREEVVLRKDVEERPQTVSDTVRRTEVEVDRDPERGQEKPRRA